MISSKPYDVIVAGGGMAGIASAIAAARNRAKTLLVEKAGWLGGLGIAGATGLHNFFNIFDAFPGAERLRVVAGIAQELVDLVQKLGGGLGHVRLERGGDYISMVTPVEPEVFKMAAAKMCIESGVELLFHTFIDDVKVDNGLIKGIIASNKSGRTLIEAKQFIDCTGDGDIAAYAGAPNIHYRKGVRGSQPTGFTFRMCNIDLEKLEADLEKNDLIVYLAHAVKPGTTKPDLVRIGINMPKFNQVKGVKAFPFFIASSLRPRELTHCNCINTGPLDGLNAKELTEAEIFLREQMFNIGKIFQKHVEGCQESYVASPAPVVGQRRTRAICTEYELRKKDCTEGKQFDDQIGCFSFIDFPRKYVKDAGAFGIPYRCLIPLKVKNLLVAGRMISKDYIAHNSTRNTVCCLVCGQAAGTAASIAALENKNPRDVNIDQLRNVLLNEGVLLKPKPDPI